MRFYFHTYNGTGFVPDEEGLELDDLPAARVKAVEGIRSILSDEVRHGSLDLRGKLEIVEEGGEIAAVIPFAEVLELHLETGQL